MLTPPHEIRRALDCLVPLVKQYWERPVQAYASALYDGFELVKGADGRNAFAELPDDVPTVRRCEALPQGDFTASKKGVIEGRKGPDGLPCTVRALK